MRRPEERDGTGVPRILGIGDATVDIYLSDDMQYPGGNTVNVAVHAARCGAAASWLGCLGRDALGALVLDALLAEGVDISHARCLDGPNPWSRIRHTNGERSFAGSDPGVRARYALTEADDQFIARHDVVHTSVHSDLDGEIGRLRAASRLLSYDYSEHWRRPGVAATMRHVDIAFLSAPERDDEACAALLAWCTSQGPGIAVATRGAQGAVALADDRMLRQSPPGVVPVDTLGAGDGFIAAFLVAHATGCELAECLARGVAYAATVCGIKGAFGRGVTVQPGQPGLDPVPTAPLTRTH